VLYDTDGFWPEHLPRPANDRDELPNRLIEI
jgi:hypothetical protein